MLSVSSLAMSKPEVAKNPSAEEVHGRMEDPGHG